MLCSGTLRRYSRVVVACALTVMVSAWPGLAHAQVETEGFPVTVEHCGRTLTFDEPPSRVVSGYQPAFETLAAMGLGDRLIGRLNFSELGPDGFLPGQKEVYDAVPEISPTIALPAKEVMLSLDADLVVETGPYNFAPNSGQATIDELTAAGTQVYLVAGWCDEEGVRDARVDNIIQDVRNLGKIFGIPDRAEKLAAEREGMLADVERRVAGREPVAVLATDGGEGPVNVHGGAGFYNHMIELAGGRNVLADVNEDYTQVSVERIAASDPDALLVEEYDSYLGEARPSAEAKAATVFALIPDSPAALQRRFLPVPAAAYPGYRTFFAIEEIAKFLHPDAFEE
ncbi:MAG: ABC transporter substrate-binding protein [Egibacteraceae bacterium]